MKPVLLCLHGWGGSKESFTELRAALHGTDIEILTPDLPGFGAEPEPKTPWTVENYAEWVETFLKGHGTWDKGQHEIHLLGHSHGGRIAMKLALRGNVKIAHLYLCASAGIRHGRHFKRIIGLTIAKSGKFFMKMPGLKHLAPLGQRLLYRLVRVHDYEKASPVMRQTMILVTREDFRPHLSSITIPTDIFWGTDDRMTPVGDAYVMHEKIAGSHLHIYKGIRHNVHREKAKEIGGLIQKTV